MTKTALFPGRFQPWHAGHRAIVEKLWAEGFFVVIGVRDPEEGDKLNYFEVFDNIRTSGMGKLGERYTIQSLGFDTLVHGRDVGYEIRQIHLDKETEAIRGRDLRSD